VALAEENNYDIEVRMASLKVWEISPATHSSSPCSVAMRSLQLRYRTEVEVG
jgi:hypothetical protein